MNDPESDSSFFEFQLQVLNSAPLTADDRLFFCRCLCSLGFRNGWLVTDSRWTGAMIESARRLHDQGYLELSYGHDGSPRVRLCNLPDEHTQGKG